MSHRSQPISLRTPSRLRALKVLLPACSCLLLATCKTVPSTLEQVLSLNELRVVTRNSPMAYYNGAEGPEGPEYDLVRAFADELGVPLFIYTVSSFEEIRRQIASGRAHVAAAGLTTDNDWGRAVVFAPPYQQVRQHLVYKQGDTKPRSFAELNGSDLQVAANSAQSEALRRVRAGTPNRLGGLVWTERKSDALALLDELAKEEIEYTIADSMEFAIGRNVNPQLRVAFDLVPGQQLAWALNDRDTSLLERANGFFERIFADGTRKRILEHYYGKSQRFERVDSTNFIVHVRTRLPQYRRLFEEAAAKVGEDWRLLAAIGYQESHWDAAAVSYTGVRGIMMLTEQTARHVGITNRDDPHQSILGGSQYFASLVEKMPARIPEPDRTWLALAAYNVGYGHLEDARVLTQSAGHDPDSWQDVRRHLPLLAQEQWYTKTKLGYARGWEPVRFVENIRNYMDILEWLAADSGPANAVR